MSFWILLFLSNYFSLFGFYDVIKYKTIENNRNFKKVIFNHLECEIAWNLKITVLLCLSMCETMKKLDIRAQSWVIICLLFYCLRTIENNRKTMKTMQNLKFFFCIVLHIPKLRLCENFKWICSLDQILLAIWYSWF